MGFGRVFYFSRWQEEEAVGKSQKSFSDTILFLSFMTTVLWQDFKNVLRDDRWELRDLRSQRRRFTFC